MDPPGILGSQDAVRIRITLLRRHMTPLTTVNSIKLETGLRPNSAGIPHTLLLRIEAIGFPTFWLML